jgi:hypothetical protein
MSQRVLRAAQFAVLALLSACGGGGDGGSSGPSFEPDFPLHWTEAGRTITAPEQTYDVVTTWEFRDARDRPVPGVVVHFETEAGAPGGFPITSTTEVNPDDVTSDASGRITFTWSFRVTSPLEVVVVYYCFAYRQDCEPDFEDALWRAGRDGITSDRHGGS